MNNLYKFILGIIAMVLVLFGLRSLINADTEGDNNVIYFYNWGDYVDPTVIEDFEAETGYNVIYETFDSNEAMITKVEQGATAYDLVVPSDYTIEMMIDKDLLLPLDYSKIEGIENIDPIFLDQSFDPGNKYSIPYFWGSVGIVYNTKKYTEEDVKYWANLWDAKFENDILLYDGAREVLGIGLVVNGRSLNEKDPDILEKTANDLKGLMDNVKAILADEIAMYMAQEEANIGITFSGTAALAMSENEDLDYYVPEEGSNIFYDNFVIPKTCQNPEGAYALLNYFLRPDIAARNANYVWYSSPNRAALEYIDEEALGEDALYPEREVIERLEVYEYLGQETTILYNDLFLELKISPQTEE